MMHHRSAEPCGADDLRTLFLFDGLADQQLTQLCTTARIEVYEAGPVVEDGRDARSEDTRLNSSHYGLSRMPSSA